MELEHTWNGRPYHSLDWELKHTFGHKVYKLSLDAGLTCPNRDGTCGTRGCIFCSEGGSGDFAESLKTDVWDQIEAAKGRVSNKTGSNEACNYIAYFQSFTNTYAPVFYLKPLFERAISHPDIAALSIATRPDCLGDDIIDLLKELNSKKPVWVELGLQTIHEKTARFIRRGYELPMFEDALKRLKKAGITVIVHVILGLPGETPEMMVQTARYIGQSGADGIKLHLLHVLSGTDLAEDYAAGNFETMTLDAYLSVLEDCLRVLPRELVIHRMTGDGAKRSLIAPMWSADKKRVLNALNRRFLSDDLEQGSALLL